MHTFLSRVLTRLPGFEEIGMNSVSSNRQASLWLGNHCRLSNGPVAHIEHMGVSACACRAVHLRFAVSCSGHHSHCFLVLGLQLVVRSLKDVPFLISFIGEPPPLGQSTLPDSFRRKGTLPSQRAGLKNRREHGVPPWLVLRGFLVHNPSLCEYVNRLEVPPQEIKLILNTIRCFQVLDFLTQIERTSFPFSLRPRVYGTRRDKPVSRTVGIRSVE